MRKALVIGIDHYEHISGLHGCVNDAHDVKGVLERHADGSVNFDVRLLTGTGPGDLVTRKQLKDAVTSLFSGDEEIALLFFAGHGHVEATGGYLCTSDSDNGDDGLPLSDLLTLATKSRVQNKVIVLDSCFSGAVASDVIAPEISTLAEGMTILTASTAEQYSTEENGSGVFTTLFVDALNGAAGNLVGDVTPGSVYAHIDQSLGSWRQRPVFKTNVKSFVSLRKVQAPIALDDLRKLTSLFPNKGCHYSLDPSYEPERCPSDTHLPPPDPAKTAVFAVLQKYNRVNLVVPVDAPHMWHAAMQSKACRLTVLGEHYRRLIASGRI